MTQSTWSRSLTPGILAALLATASGQDVASTECAGECVATWRKCGGRGIDTQLPCCEADDVCKYNDRSRPTYGQCRPVSGPRSEFPAHWKDPFAVACSAGGGPSPPAECDPAAMETTVYWGGVTVLSDEPHSLGSFFFEGEDITCKERCAAEAECFVYEENSDGDCFLFKKSVIGPDVRVRFSIDNVIDITKCYTPDPLCALGTDALVAADASLPYYELAENDWVSIQLSGDDAVAQCGTLSRMQSAKAFAIDAGEFSTDAVTCTPLWTAADDAPFTAVPYSAVADSAVYSIAAC